MVTRNIKFEFGEFYHLYNRGTDKREIFIDDQDRERFIKLLFVANGTNSFVFRDFPIGLPYVEFNKGANIVAIGSYCLMPNHFHILIKEISTNGITIFMNKVLTSYSMYFNKKYKRTGRLFEGSFKAKHANEDSYLKYLFAYIHLNPVKLINRDWKEKGISDNITTEKFLIDYKYSSYLDYLNKKRIENKILDKESFPEYFQKIGEFNDFIKEWLYFKEGHIG